MQKKTGSFKENFSKNAYYRFLRSAGSNWLRFTTLLSERIINGHLRGLTSADRADCFVIDDSLYERTGYKKTELASRVFGHVTMRYKKGFRLMTLGWTDGCSFIPINSSLLASSKEEHILGKTNDFDKRSLAGKRMNVKQIYKSCKKRRGRSKYLLSVKVNVGDEKKDGYSVDARIVCVRNRSNKKDWLVLICTDMPLSENEIIRIYGKHWDIEVFFKTCKGFLHLGSEYHGLSYDAITAHVAFVFTRYMLMSVAKRNDEDERTLGKLSPK